MEACGEGGVCILCVTRTSDYTQQHVEACSEGGVCILFVTRTSDYTQQHMETYSNGDGEKLLIKK